MVAISFLDEKELNQLIKTCKELSITPLVEIFNKYELNLALDNGADVIGINNRNLKTLKTDLNTTYDIHDVLINHNGPLISESGIKSKDDLLQLSNKTTIKTFLIGESILKNLNNNSIFSVL